MEASYCSDLPPAPNQSFGRYTFQRIGADDPYYQTISNGWGEALKSVPILAEPQVLNDFSRRDFREKREMEDRSSRWIIEGRAGDAEAEWFEWAIGQTQFE